MLQLRQDYKTAFSNHCQSPNSQVTLAAYLDAHNAYVNQLHATNAMVDLYSKETLPELLQVSMLVKHEYLFQRFAFENLILMKLCHYRTRVTSNKKSEACCHFSFGTTLIFK